MNANKIQFIKKFSLLIFIGMNSSTFKDKNYRKNQQKLIIQNTVRNVGFILSIIGVVTACKVLYISHRSDDFNYYKDNFSTLSTHQQLNQIFDTEL